MLEILKQEDIKKDIALSHFRLSSLKDTLQNGFGNKYIDKENGFKLDTTHYRYLENDMKYLKEEIIKWEDSIVYYNYLLTHYKEMNEDFNKIYNDIQDFKNKYEGNIARFDNWATFHNIFRTIKEIEKKDNNRDRWL